MALLFVEPGEVEQDICATLGAINLRDVFSKGTKFAKWHIDDYSRSRRKAPIYWQLATPSASYSVWLYYHRFSRDTFFQVLNEYVKPKLDHERQKLDRLRGEGGAEPTRSQRKEIEDQEKFVAELASMAEEVERIAPLWNPNLNDGVIINFAPLWRLVPQNKSWQKECKNVLGQAGQGRLRLGAPGHAPLARTRRPQMRHRRQSRHRSRPGRSLLAAGRPRSLPAEGGTRRRLGAGHRSACEERTSAAVKAALESLLDVPAPSWNSTRSRGRRASS